MNARPTAADAAPPFAPIARMPGATEMSLRVFLQTPHANMPDYQLKWAARSRMRLIWRRAARSAGE